MTWWALQKKRLGCFWKCLPEQWICEIKVMIHYYISSHLSPLQITAALGITGKGRAMASVRLYPQLSDQGNSIRNHQGHICKGRGGSSQWQWAAAFLSVTWEILPLLDTFPAWLYFTLTQENSEYSPNFAWQLMQTPTMPSEDWTAAVTVDSWCCLDGHFHWLLYQVALF